MKQEQKELLIKDICARLPYGVKVDCTDGVVQLKSVDFELGSDKPVFWHGGHGTNLTIEDDNIKPYLIPLSKMTEEQREELYKIGWYLDEDKIYSRFRNYDDVNYKTHIDCFELINWCYKNNFDINGLIPMGLAIDATDKNIYNH